MEDKNSYINQILLKVPYLIPDASDASKCKHIGYLFDGFPVHGQCQDADGNEILSCYKLIGKLIYDTEKNYFAPILKYYIISSSFI